MKSTARGKWVVLAVIGALASSHFASAESERTLLMGAMEDTSLGEALDGAGVELSGWTELSVPSGRSLPHKASRRECTNRS
jgi:hypothetical protein